MNVTERSICFSLDSSTSEITAVFDDSKPYLNT